MMALDRFGAITSHNYMTKSSSGHYRVRIWIVTLTVWLCAYFLTRQMWVNTEYTDEGRDSRTLIHESRAMTNLSVHGSLGKGDIATCKMNWGLPVDEDIKDFVRSENGCHQCPVDGDVLEQCADIHANHDESPVKIDFLTELGWNQENCTLAYYRNSTGDSDYEDAYQKDYLESSASEMSSESTYAYDNASSSSESTYYEQSQNYLCGHGLENNR